MMEAKLKAAVAVLDERIAEAERIMREELYDPDPNVPAEKRPDVDAIMALFLTVKDLYTQVKNIDGEGTTFFNLHENMLSFLGGILTAFPHGPHLMGLWCLRTVQALREVLSIPPELIPVILMSEIQEAQRSLQEMEAQGNG